MNPTGRQQEQGPTLTIDTDPLEEDEAEVEEESIAPTPLSMDREDEVPVST